MNSFFEYVKYLLFSDIRDLFGSKDVKDESGKGDLVLFREEPPHQLSLEKEFLITKVIFALKQDNVFIRLEKKGVNIVSPFIFVWIAIDNHLTDDQILINLSSWTDNSYILESEYIKDIIVEIQYIIAITMYDYVVNK